MVNKGAIMSTYYEKNKDKVKEYQREYRATEEAKEYQKEYQSKYGANWRESNTEKRLLLGAKNRAKKKNIECSLV